MDESKILREAHSMLNILVKRVDSTEKDVKEMKRHLHNQGTSSKRKKKDVSPVVRVSSM